MNTNATTIDVYDRDGHKLIEGITPINSINQKLPIFKDYRDQ